MKTDIIKKEVVILIFILIIIFYLGWDSKIYNFDGTVYSFQLNSASHGEKIYRLYSPYHMLYLPMAWVIYKGAISLGINLSAMAFLQMLNLVFGILALLVLYKFTMKRLLSRDYALFATLLAAVSYSFWFMSHEAETYILTLLFILLFFWFLFDYKPHKFRFSKPLTAGFLFGLCMLGHVSAALIIFPALYLLHSRKLLRVVNTLIFMVSAAAVTIVPYLVFYYRSPYRGFTTYKTWLLQAVNYTDLYNVDVNFWEVGFKSLYQTFVSAFNAVVTNYNYGKINYLLLIMFRAALAAVILYLLYQLIIKAKSFSKDDSFFLRWSLVWFVPLTVFYTFWGVSHFKFRILTLPPLIFMLTIAVFKTGLGKKENCKYFAALGLILIILAFNFTVSYLPAYKEENNPDYLRAKWIGDVTPTNSLIVIMGLSGYGYEYGKIYIVYFANRYTLILNWFAEKDEKGLLPAEMIINNVVKNGIPVFVLSEVFNEKLLDKLIEKHPSLTKEEFQNIFKQHRITLWREMEPGFALYRLN